VIERQTAFEIRDALAQLHYTEAAVVEAAFLDGRSHEEIARKMALPLGTIKTRIRAGLRRLRPLINVLCEAS